MGRPAVDAETPPPPQVPGKGSEFLVKDIWMNEGVIRLNSNQRVFMEFFPMIEDCI